MKKRSDQYTDNDEFWNMPYESVSDDGVFDLSKGFYLPERGHWAKHGVAIVDSLV